MGVELSSISRRIRDLEDRLGAALFHRDSTGIRLTFPHKQQSHIPTIPELGERPLPPAENLSLSHHGAKAGSLA